MKLNPACLLFVCCLLPAHAARAADSPPDIPEAPLSDDTLPPLPSPEIAKKPDSTALLSGIDRRIYWLSSFEFSPEKTAAVAGPQSLLFRQAPPRSGHLQMNGEFSTRLFGRLFLKLDLQADYFPYYDEDESYGIRLNELFLEYRFFPAFSVLAGKYRRMYGPGMFRNPMDRHTPAAYLPGQPLQREGAYLLQLTWTPPPAATWISDAAVTAAFLPGVFFDEYGLPAARVDFLQITDMGQIGAGSESWSAKRTGGFVRGYANLARGDANLLLYYYESQWQLGASYCRYLASPWLEAHVEALGYRLPHDRRELGASSYWDGMAGIRIEPRSMSGIIVEWLHCSERQETVPATFMEQRQLFNNLLRPGTHLTAVMPFRDYFVLTTFCQPWKDRLTVRGNAIVHPDGRDALWTLRGDLALGDHTQVSLTGMLVTASSGGYYTTAIPFPWRLTAELWMYL